MASRISPSSEIVEQHSTRTSTFSDRLRSVGPRNFNSSDSVYYGQGVGISPPEETVEQSTRPSTVSADNVGSSLSDSIDGRQAISCESASDKFLRRLLAKLVRGSYRFDRLWKASRCSMEVFDKQPIKALGYSRVSFNSLGIPLKCAHFFFCVFEREAGPRKDDWSLAVWCPIIYVNEGDVLSNGYIHALRSMKKLGTRDPGTFKAMYGRSVAVESVKRHSCTHKRASYNRLVGTCQWWDEEVSTTCESHRSHPDVTQRPVWWWPWQHHPATTLLKASLSSDPWIRIFS